MYHTLRINQTVVSDFTSLEKAVRSAYTQRAPPKLPPPASVNRTLFLGDLGEALFVILRVLFDRLFDLRKQATVKLLFLHPVAQKQHGVGFAPIFAVLPNFYRIATHLFGHFYEERIINVMAITEKNLVIGGYQLNLQLVERFGCR